jgi:hypothetical protein
MEEQSPYARPAKYSNTRRYDEDIHEEFESLSLMPRNPTVKDNVQDQNLQVQDLYARYSGELTFMDILLYRVF